VKNTERYPLGFGWELLAEDRLKQGVDDGMEPPFGEAVPVLLRLPNVNVPKPAFGAFDRDMSYEALGRLRAEALPYPIVEVFADRDILSKRVHLIASLLSSEAVSD
jgi:hypothetical protein